jgi:hypothetical protein
MTRASHVTTTAHLSRSGIWLFTRGSLIDRIYMHLVVNCVPERSICLHVFVSSATGHRISVKFNNSGHMKVP